MIPKFFILTFILLIHEPIRGERQCGTFEDVDQLPYYMFLIHGEDHYCTGTAVSPNHLLTSKSCFRNQNRTKQNLKVVGLNGILVSQHMVSQINDPSDPVALLVFNRQLYNPLTVTGSELKVANSSTNLENVTNCQAMRYSGGNSVWEKIVAYLFNQPPKMRKQTICFADENITRNEVKTEIRVNVYNNAEDCEVNNRGMPLICEMDGFDYIIGMKQNEECDVGFIDFHDLVLIGGDYINEIISREVGPLPESSSTEITTNGLEFLTSTPIIQETEGTNGDYISENLMEGISSSTEIPTTPTMRNEDYNGDYNSTNLLDEFSSSTEIPITTKKRRKAGKKTGGRAPGAIKKGA